MAWTWFLQIFLLLTWTAILVMVTYGYITDKAVLRAIQLLNEERRNR